ncbi:MAG: efflux RND transporter permease subunit, partial [Candidatus Thioglobus sp.]
MDIFSFLVRQKKLAMVFTLSVITIGILALNNIQRDQFPNVDFEIMTVFTAYPGASPEDVEQNVTNPLEDELGNISGIDKFTSISRAGSSAIIIKLSQDFGDIIELKQEIRNAVNRVKSLPDEVVDLPKVIDQKASIKNILKISIGSDVIGYAKLREIVDDIASEIDLVSGVSETSKKGYLDKEIQVKIDPQKLYLHKLSMPQIMSAINKRNKRYTVGNNNSAEDEKTIVVLSKFTNAEEVGEVIVKSSFSGPIVRLKDVAKITTGNIEEKSIVRVNRKKGFILEVKKQAQADIITTVDLVKQKVLEENLKYDNKLQIFYAADLSKYVRNRLNIVTNNGIIGLLLVLIILGIFLSFKTAFWVAVSLPVSLLGSVALLGLAGETINLVSLAAMILVLGIVVDDSIIVAESAHYYRQQGGDKYEAVIKGFKRVIMPVITTILTTILAFSSMFLMNGTMGKFIYVIPLVVIFALSLSFLEVLIALPAHLASTKIDKNTNNWFAQIESKFEILLTQVLKHKYAVVTLFFALLVFSLLFAKTQMQLVLFPAVGVDNIGARLVMKTGSSLSNTEHKTEEVEALIEEVVGADLVSITTNVGNYYTHKAKFNIELIPSSERKSDSKTILDQLKLISNKISGVEKLRFFVRRPGPPQGEDVEIVLVAKDNDKRQKAAVKLEQILSSIAGVDNIERDDDPGKDRIEIVLDYEKMARLEIEQSDNILAAAKVCKSLPEALQGAQ